MKTIKQWLEELPEPYRSQATANIEKLNSSPAKDFKANADDLYDAISGAFVWQDSPEGHNYWSEVAITFSAPSACTPPNDEQ